MKPGPRDTAPGRRLDVTLLVAAVVVTAASALSTVVSASDPTTVTGNIRLTIDRGDYAEAERRARSLLEGLEASAQGGTLEAALALDLLVETLQRQERGYSADIREMAERALEIKRRHLPSDHPDLAPSLANMARVRLEIDLDLPAALALSEEALRIARRAPEPGHPRLARYWTARARILVETGDFETARADLDEALGLMEPGSPPTHWVDTLDAYGWLEWSLTNFAGAAARFDAALQRVQSTLGEDHLETARMHSGLAKVHAQTGQYNLARESAEHCLAILEIRHGGEHPRAADCLAVLGWIASDTGTLTRSRRIFEQALGVFERTVGPEHRRLLPLLNTYASLLFRSRDLQASKVISERAIDIAERYFGASDYRIGWLLNGYGNMLRKLGDDAGAERAFKRALALADASGRPSLLQWSSAMINLAHHKQTIGELDEARRLYSEAMTVFEDFPLNPIWKSEIKQVYGDLLSRLGEHTEAQRLLVEALDMRRRQLGPEHYKVANTLDSYADALERAGNVPGAFELRRQALEIMEKTYGEDGSPVGLELWEIAWNRLRAGRPAEALATALRAERIRARSLRLTASALPESSALEYAGAWPSAQSVLLTAAVGPRGAAAADPWAPWDAVVRSRAVVTDELAARHRSLAEAGVPAELEEELTAARERVASLLVRGEGADYAARFREALATKERVETRVAAISADFRRQRNEAEVGLAEVAEAVPPDAALLALVRYNHLERASGSGADTPPLRRTPSYAAFVLSPGSRSVTLVPLGPAERIDAAVDAWLAEVSTPPASIRTLSIESLRRYRKAGETLRGHLWDPVTALVKGASHVLVVPDATLNAVNFATLPTGTSGYLLEEGPEFHYLSAERDVAARESLKRRPRLLAVGGPDFDAGTTVPDLATVADDATLRAALESGPGTVRFRGERPSCRDFRTLRFRALVGAVGEVEEISTIWSARQAKHFEVGAPRVQELTGPRAHEAWFKALASEYDVLHLATHGFFLDSECAPVAGSPTNPLLLSGLALAGANNRGNARDDGEDGILTAEEVAALDLTNADWVVLSGCETGRGRAVGGEGIFGLRRAFRVAGARTLIMSLWAVDDDATRRWMRALYEARSDGATTSASVRKAALQVLVENRRAGLPDHPFYWGAFVAAGDWR